MAHFYGLKWYEIEAMPVDKYKLYVEAKERIIAGDMLQKLEVASFPYKDKEARNKIFKKYENILKPSKEVKRFEDAFKDVAKWQTKR